MYTWKHFILLVLLLAAANWAAHGHALWDGLFLDDHWHELRLAENDWSLAALFDATTIDPQRFMHAWWQEKPISWWYIRPFAVFVAKVVYHVSGGSVKALHGLSILLHLANALMVHHLVLRMTRRRWWSIVAALLVVVYSHSVYAVAWLAAQNALLETALTLGALLLYVRASGLDLYAGPRDDDSIDDGSTGRPLRPLSWPAAAGFLVLWMLALLSREIAVTLPFFLVAFDLAFGGWRQVRARIGLYVVVAAIAAGFLAWRFVFFDHPMPGFYVRRPDGPAYILWWLAKLMHDMTSTVWLSPMTVGPTARYHPWTEVPGDCVLMLIILAVMGVGYQMSCRRIRGYWIWPLWILIGLVPVVSIMATPHNAYLPSMGFAIAMGIGPALRHVTRPTSLGRWCPGVTAWFLIATTIYMPIYRPMWYSMLAAERMTIDQVTRMPPGPQTTDVFFINLPFVNIYARYHLDEAMGRRPRLDVARQVEPRYRTHVLTYAPDLLRMDVPCRVEQLDAWRFRVSIEGRPYFSSALGRFLIEGLRPDKGPFNAGEVVAGDVFDVRVGRVSEQGVWDLEFRFHRPLADEGFCFYVGTPSCAAARLRFAGPAEVSAWAASGPEPGPPTRPDETAGTVSLAAVRDAADRLRAGQATAADVLFAAADDGDVDAKPAARQAIAGTCRPVAEALAAPVLGYTSCGEAAWADWRRVRRWWAWHVDDTAVRVLPACLADYGEMRWRRDALFRIRRIASTIVRADLYLTGPPFPGPR
ncbi:MAG: hypothetical protein HY718_19870 [Planctomycetes bacterium]|nr:hypothetical protein [Planctomycetota bacterium]